MESDQNFKSLGACPNFEFVFLQVCFCGLPATDAERTEILSVCLKSLSTDFAFDVQTMGRNIPSTFSPADIQVLLQSSFDVFPTACITTSDQMQYI